MACIRGKSSGVVIGAVILNYAVSLYGGVSVAPASPAIIEQPALSALAITLLVVIVVVFLVIIRLLNTRFRKLLSRLEENYDYFNAVFNRSSQLTGLLSPDGVVLSLNESALSFISALPEDVEGLKLWETPWWNSSEENQQKVKSAIDRAAAKETVQFESMHHNFNGETFFFNVNVSPVKGDYDKVNMLIIEARDVSELKQAEQRFRSLFENAADAIIILSGTRCANSNSKALELFCGKSKQQLDGLEFSDLCPKIQADGMPSSSQAETLIQRALDFGVQTFEWKMRRLDESPFDAEITLSRIELSDKFYVQAVIRDVSEKKDRENEYKKLSAVVEQSSEMILITNLQGKIEYVNRAFEEITGYSAEEVKGKSPSMLKSGRHKDEFYQDIWATISKGQCWHGRIINRTKNDQLYTEEARIFPIRDNEGKIIHYVALTRDITRELEAEEMLRHSQKMESLGILAGGVAHDFNNILTGIFGLIRLCEKNINKPDKIEKFIEEMDKASERARVLVKQILSFSSNPEQDIRPVVIAEVLSDTLELLRSTLPRSVNIVSEIDSRSKVLADPGGLQQAIINLCSNAYEAMKDGGGTMTISLHDIIAGENEFGLRADVPPGNYVKLEISDTGCGIPREHLKRIFEPYFTVNKNEHTSGLGLAVAHGILRAMNAQIDVYSEVGIGTTFKIYLPVTDAVEADISPEMPVIGGDETIMIVDDEKIITQVLGGLLEEYGYRVMAFNDPVDALESFKNMSGQIDVVITDMSMPGLSGVELSAKMHELNPEQLIIICTGFSDNVNAESARAAGIKGFMHKPMEISALLADLRRLINENPKSGEK
jgi:PAS domain S-box-containing protein